MNITSTQYNLNFNAKFANSNSLQEITKYAVKNNKFELLNQARKNIESAKPDSRIRVDLCYTNEFPTIIFSRYEPIKSKGSKENLYKLKSRIEMIANESGNVVKYGFSKILKLGKSAPDNNMFHEIFIKRPYLRKHENFFPFGADI